VPAGCLLETNAPVATAIATSLNDGSTSTTVPSDSATRFALETLPLSTLAVGYYPGRALADYERKGEEELSVAKDDRVTVYQEYNNWFYVSVCNMGRGLALFLPSVAVLTSPG
jgi:protein STE50